MSGPVPYSSSIPTLRWFTLPLAGPAWEPIPLAALVARAPMGVGLPGRQPSHQCRFYETEPIPPHGRKWARAGKAGERLSLANRAKQSQFFRTDRKRREPPRAEVEPPLGPSAQNKANFPKASGRVSALQENGYSEFDPPEDSTKQSQSRRTGGNGSGPARPGRAPLPKRAKQSQSLRTDRNGRGPVRPRREPRWDQACETKPICPERQEGQVLWGKRVMMNSPPQELRQDKANFEGRSWRVRRRVYATFDENTL